MTIVILSSMARYPAGHKERTRRRILEAAGRVFRRRGLHGGGIDAVMAEAGLTPGGFYHHFENKDDLVATMLAVAVEQSESSREHGLDGLDGPRWVRGLLERYLSEGHRGAIDEGCPVPAMVSEIGRSGPEVRRSFEHLLEGLVERLARSLEGAGPDGEEAAATERSRQQAWALFALAAGGIALARAVEDGETAREVLAGCRALAVTGIESMDDGIEEPRT